MDVSIIIVNYNTKDLLKECIDSIYEQTKEITFEIIVSDNGSSDGSIEMLKNYFPSVIIIENNANLGFGAANNRGLKIAHGKYIFYLNSDTVLLNNAVKCFFDFWEQASDKDSIGAIGANLLNENGEIIHSYGFFPSYKNEIKRLINSYISILLNYLLHFFNKQIHKKSYHINAYFGDVDFITGADLFLKNDKNACFDERFFLYFEETDLQFQLSKKGLRRIIIKGPEIIHLEGASDNRRKENIDRFISFSAQQIFLSRIIYFKKNLYKKLQLQIIYFFTMKILKLSFYKYKTKEIQNNIQNIIKY